MSVFDLPEGLRAEVSRLRVECLPYEPDSKGPVRLLLIGSDDTTLASLRFTPAQARDTGPTISRLLSHFLPSIDVHKVSDGLLKAARKVISTRN